MIIPFSINPNVCLPRIRFTMNFVFHSVDTSIKSLLIELIPAGGTAVEVLAKNEATNSRHGYRIIRERGNRYYVTHAFRVQLRNNCRRNNSLSLVARPLTNDKTRVDEAKSCVSASDSSSNCLLFILILF